MSHQRIYKTFCATLKRVAEETGRRRRSEGDLLNQGYRAALKDILVITKNMDCDLSELHTYINKVLREKTEQHDTLF